MIHVLYLVGFAFFVSIAFAIYHNGETKARILYGAKVFAQFVLISLILAWILYLIPW
jgi:TRAP-type mannitol/chloroaromatic compound transport system permease small subunit